MFLQVPNPWTRAWLKLAGRAWLYNYKLAQQPHDYSYCCIFRCQQISTWDDDSWSGFGCCDLCFWRRLRASQARLSLSHYSNLHIAHYFLQALQLTQAKNKISRVPTYCPSNSRTSWDPDQKASPEKNVSWPIPIWLVHFALKPSSATRKLYLDPYPYG